VIEVALRPAHARRFRGLWQPATEIAETAGATRRERRWLAAYSLELAALRPEQVIKRLYATIIAEAALVSASEYVDTEDGVEYFVHARAFAGEAKASDGGPDSFG
jgi:hypothetical protein